MKKIIFYLSLIALVLFTGCKDEQDTRTIPQGKIVAMNINNVLYTIDNDSIPVPAITLVLPAGMDLSAVKTTILVSNGTLLDFQNGALADLRLPFDVTIAGQDGRATVWHISVQSPPQLQQLTVEGLNIDSKDVHVGEFINNEATVVTQVPVGTDITKLKATYVFANGTMTNYTNGTVMDYTTPFDLKVRGVDQTTSYTFKMIYTDQPVGPASINSMTVDGIVSDSVVTTGNTVQAYFPCLINYASATVSFGTGFGNVVDPNFVSTNVNLLTTQIVNVKGSDGVTVAFSVVTPLIKPVALMSKNWTDLQFAANAGSSAAFSNGKILIDCHQMASGASATYGINEYTLTGNYIKGLSKVGTNYDAGAAHGIRKFATDADGKILGVQLGAGVTGSTQLTIYKWDTPDAAPSAYINYSQTSLGLSYPIRSAGINIQGSLAGNAIITVPMAQKQDVLAWTVTGGVLNPIPQLKSFPYTGTGYYYSVEALGAGFVAANTATSFNGLSIMNSTMISSFSLNNTQTTDLRTFTYKNRTYIAYVCLKNGAHYFRIVDVTTPSNEALSTPIMNIEGPQVSNGNVTVDADMSVINGKLHVLFLGTNDRVVVYKLEN